MKLPKHDASLTLTHNDHKSVYETVEQWLVNNQWCDWENMESRQRAIDTNEVWTLQWYPDSPVGFFAVAAPTLDEVLAYAQRVEHGVTLPDSA